MKRLWLAILLALFTATAIVPCEAVCPASQPAPKHDCCMTSGHTAEATCCTPHEKQPAATPQANPATPALAHLAAPSFLIAHAALLEHISPAAAAPNLNKPPQLILRT